MRHHATGRYAGFYRPPVLLASVNEPCANRGNTSYLCFPQDDVYTQHIAVIYDVYVQIYKITLLQCLTTVIKRPDKLIVINYVLVYLRVYPQSTTQIMKPTTLHRI